MCENVIMKPIYCSCYFKNDTGAPSSYCMPSFSHNDWHLVADNGWYLGQLLESAGRFRAQAVNTGANTQAPGAIACSSKSF